MITAHNMLRNAWSRAGHHLPKACQQLRQLKQHLQLRLPSSTVAFWRQTPQAQPAAMSNAPRPRCHPAVRWGTTACNDAHFRVAPPPAPCPARAPRALRAIQVITSDGQHRPLMHLRLSGRLDDVCSELDRLAAMESGH